MTETIATNQNYHCGQCPATLLCITGRATLLVCFYCEERIKMTLDENADAEAEVFTFCVRSTEGTKSYYISYSEWLQVKIRRANLSLNEDSRKIIEFFSEEVPFKEDACFRRWRFIVCPNCFCKVEQAFSDGNSQRGVDVYKRQVSFPFGPIKFNVWVEPEKPVILEKGSGRYNIYGR